MRTLSNKLLTEIVISLLAAEEFTALLIHLIDFRLMQYMFIFNNRKCENKT